MNRYLRSGARLVGAIVLALGIVSMAAGIALLVDAVPYWMSPDPSMDGWRDWSDGLAGALFAGALSIACFRYWSKLRKEQREGIQI